jgi:hypothetical protein
MARTIDHMRRTSVQLGSSLAGAIGRHLIATGRRARSRVRALTRACALLPVEVTASPHALAAGLIGATAGLVRVPGGPLGGAVMDRVATRAARALAIRRARRIRAWLPASEDGARWLLVPPANDIRVRDGRTAWQRLAAFAQSYAIESLPLVGATASVARAASAGIEAWAVVVAAELYARREVEAHVRALEPVAVYRSPPCELPPPCSPFSLPAPDAIELRVRTPAPRLARPA